MKHLVFAMMILVPSLGLALPVLAPRVLVQRPIVAAPVVLPTQNDMSASVLAPGARFPSAEFFFVPVTEPSEEKGRLTLEF